MSNNGFFLNFSDGMSTIYYSGIKNDTYQNSIQHCMSLGGSLLSYSELMVKTVRKCQKTGEVPNLWTATPWYNRECKF
jgi:hypothetical protein